MIGGGGGPIPSSGSAPAAAVNGSGGRRKEEMVRGRVEGPIPNQTLSQFLNRAHVHAIVKRCLMDKETKVWVIVLVAKGQTLQTGKLIKGNWQHAFSIVLRTR